MKGFWDKFEDLMESLPGAIENMVKSNDGHSISTSIVVQDGNTIKTVTKNGKTTVTINGKEYVPKEARQ